jgi:site-specific DNA recombinase
MTRRKRTVSSRTAVALLRVSKDEATQALGVAAQRAAVAAWAATEGVDVVAWHLEEVSGGAPLERRPVLAAAVADVAARGAAYLVALKVDRFSRDRIETGAVELQLRRMGAELVFADGVGNGRGAADEFMRTIQLGAAQMERATIRKRITDALAVKQSRGEMTGAAPYGMRAVDGPARARKDGTVKPVKMLESDPGEQTTIARARELSASMSLRATIAALADEGHLSRAGKPFTVAAMHKILAGSPAETSDK